MSTDGQDVMIHVGMDWNNDQAVDHLIEWLEAHDSYTGAGWVVLPFGQVAAFVEYIVERRLAGVAIVCDVSMDPNIEDDGEYADQGGAA